MALKPLIGVTMPDKGNFFAYIFIKLNLKLQGAYCVRLRPSKSNVKFERLDGLILSGGFDIDPQLYGANKDAHNTPINKKRDIFELKMIKKAYSKTIPIFGICRGAQLINIYFQGTLYPTILDLDEAIIHKNSIFPIKLVWIKKLSKLYNIVRDKNIVVNSIHNQAIDKVGKGLNKSASYNKIIQSIENTNYPFLLGVQWHPEYLIYLKKHRQIFKNFVTACNKTQNTKGHL